MIVPIRLDKDVEEVGVEIMSKGKGGEPAGGRERPLVQPGATHETILEDLEGEKD
jgi:hypothetical protein